MEGLFTILQLEVLSSRDRDSTITKLAMQLMMQLIGILHMDTTQQRVAAGFNVVPTVDVDHGGKLEKSCVQVVR